MSIAFLALCTTLILNVATSRYQSWNNHLYFRVKDYEDLETASAQYKKRAEASRTLYDLVRPLTIAAHSESQSDLFQRIRQFRSLPDVAQSDGLARCERWLEAAGRVGFASSRRGGAHLRQFLQTFHLSVIREGSIAEVLLVSGLANGTLIGERDEPGLELYFRAIALSDLAKRYNSIAKQQRNDVTFTQVSISGERLVAWPAPSTSPIFLNIQDRLSPSMKLTEKRIAAVKKRLNESATILKAQEL